MHPINIYFWYAKGGDDLLQQKKMGRPTDNPKPVQIAVRFDSETLQILDEHCTREKISRAEGVRQAVRKLKKK